MPKYVFEKDANFNRIQSSSNMSHKQDKKELEILAGRTFDSLGELSSYLAKFNSNIKWEIENLPPIFTKLPVLYPWSPESDKYGYLQIGHVQVVE